LSVPIRFYFDFGSPNAYLCHLVIPDLEKRTGERIEYVPILLGGIFKATNNVSPVISLQGIKNKGEYQALETKRFLAQHKIARFARNPFFPVNTLQIMRGAIAAQNLDCYTHYVEQIYRYMWAEPRKMDDTDVIRAAIEESGLPTDELLSEMQSPHVKAKLIENTEEAVTRGVFGSPSFFVGDELFFGKDRLREIEEEIEKQKS
jgi:2-hydroxychromene-2-carboxylate isomerase